jgi:DNA-directed RNA polymerase subunit N (RpoN/RPB10)
MISEFLGAVCAIESMCHPWKSFVDDFWVLRGCLCRRIFASHVEAVSLMISETTATHFSLMISEPTWALCAVEFMRHPWKQFRWWCLRPKGAIYAVESMCHPWKQFRWWFLLYIYIYIYIDGFHIKIYRNFDGVPPIPEGPKFIDM